ncbi:siderophore-interacting protein [Nocardioides marmoriginsengisoli]|uniref:Siderophore-interacting protein n=1 Tax=Nocardioides marmoriginsengisoli TaxID=661483 RepID=A0A3N0CJT7_9ACTN|nr:siderophore-interacting protein [Nocardioides marmoriginsengisoli]RNL63705.1 siderophore-interacting protein [Nocardioides marmoriginsengisoli]
MNARPEARSFSGTVTRREVLGDHLIRVAIEGLDGFVSTGIPDEWVALTVPGQFQTRYYTVRSYDGSELVLDIVVHDEGLVTQWAQTECVGDVVGISMPKGSFELPADAAWVVLVGDLTGLPAIARIGESVTLPVTAYVETPDHPLADYTDLPITWVDAPGPEQSGVADLVRGLDWPEGPGYFWMAGESAQMRDIRRHVRQDLGRASTEYDVMGYWSVSRGRQRRAVDPGPIYAAGKAAGKSDDQIWQDYDEARGG